MRGKFIVIEGPDGSGTTRHSRELVDRLRRTGKEVLLTYEPTDSDIGKQIRAMLHGDALPSPEAMQLLFSADRAEHVATVIEPALEAGTDVVCDRYTLSTLVYGEMLGVDRVWLEDVSARFPKPDLTIITLPPFAVCEERMGRRKERDLFEQDAFQRRVYDTYKVIEDPSVLFVDTSGDRDKVADDIVARVQEYFEPLSRERLESL